MERRLECIVRGRVQGVSYRDFTARAARGLHLVGFVRNLSDGTVEVVAEGEEENLGRLLAHLKEKHPFAQVARIDEVWADVTGEFPDFRILHHSFMFHTS